MNKRFNILALILAIFLIITGCTSNNNVDTPLILEESENTEVNETEKPENNEEETEQEQQDQQEEATIDENGTYSDPYLVAEYLHTYNKLPPNFITKKEASNLGWQSDKGNLWDVTDKMSIGGDKFGNREGLLPKKDGRVYYECDVNYEGGYRGAERIVFSNDGLIFYTEDHYKSFTQLY